MNINLNIGAKGIVNIKRIRDGVVQEEHTFHNLIIENNVFYGNDSNDSIVIGIGTGSKVPTQSDNTLESMHASGISTRTYGIETDDTFYNKYTWTYGTGSGTDVNVSEIALFYSSSRVLTRALVTDAEGAPIVISKTIYDELEIIYTIYITVAAPQILSKTCTTRFFSHMLLAVSGRTYLTPRYSRLLYRDESAADSTIGYTINTSGNASTATSEYTTKHVLGYANCLSPGTYHVSGYRYTWNFNNPSVSIPFPNTDIFPVRTLTGLSLGTGDGTTTDFIPELPWWLENTEKVYKNGILLTRDIDYLVDNFHALRSDAQITTDAYFNNYKRNAAYALSLNHFFDKGTYTDTQEDMRGFILNNHIAADGSYNNTYGLYKNFRECVFTIASGNAPNLTVDTVYFKRYSNYVNGYFSANWQYHFTADISFSNDNGNTWTTLPRPAKKTSYSSNSYADIDTYNAANSGGFINNYMVKLDTPITGVTHIKFNKYAEFLTAGATEENTVCNLPSYIFIGHVGDYAIRFIDPPAEGDVLTMDCDIDRPWVGGKEVCNITVTSTLSNV